MDTVLITALDQEGRGVARLDGKAIFVEGALAGERVSIWIVKRRPTYELATTVEVLEPSPSRVEALCPHFGVCGGCSLQHLEPAAQVAAKQRVLEDTLWHIARVRADQILAPIHGPAWAYRERARLSARYVAKKGGALVGFHEKKSSFVADMTTCPILPERISAMLPAMRALVDGLSIRERLPQIELAASEDGSDAADALLLRILAPLSTADERNLIAFAERHRVRFYLQPQGPASVYLFHPPAAGPLSYSLPDFSLVLDFEPTDFTQVNSAMNRVLVRRAISLLAPEPGNSIGDFFCGIGNFTLPIARRGARVVGVEGNKDLVRRAQANAEKNGLGELAHFAAANLFDATPGALDAYGAMDKALIDPPREGAIALVKALPDSLSRIVYVSCNPATLARDTAVLVQERGYALSAVGIANMFPHTAHVESIAVFDRDDEKENGRLDAARTGPATADDQSR
jgi:23S rRNA (uracil1939-C5)-methyltransferase